MQRFACRIYGETDPHEAHRTPREYPIRIHHLPLPPRARATATTTRRAPTTSCSRTFDIIIEPLYDIPRNRFLQIPAFDAVDFIFELGLGAVNVRDRRILRSEDILGEWKLYIPIACPVRVSSAGYRAGRALIFRSRAGRGFHRWELWRGECSRP